MVAPTNERLVQIPPTSSAQSKTTRSALSKVSLLHFSCTAQLIALSVKKAWELGKKQCKIIVFDWLEDCLLGKKLKKGLRPEGPYTLDRTLARIKKGFSDHAEYRRKFEEGARASKALVDNSEYTFRGDMGGISNNSSAQSCLLRSL
jgi:hypothetical protein